MKRVILIACLPVVAMWLMLTQPQVAIAITGKPAVLAAAE